MCGLAGIVFSDPDAPAPVGRVREMTGTLVHRGPDDEGFFHLGPAALGHRRLAIIDPAGGRQPFVSEDGRVALVYNGEIYNHRELRRELSAAGHRFRTGSDTEVLLRGWLAHGPDLLDRLRGMFAFAVYDHRERRLFLARDRLGIKPLYYALSPRGIVFGSELKAVLASGLVERRVDLRALLDYLNLRYVPGPKSILEGVRKLPPAHLLEYHAGRARLSRYWTVSFEPDRSVAPRVWRERVRDRLMEAVRLRMVSDVPLGAFLSGGIDSASVVALMKEAADGPVKTATVGFSGRSHDETDHARFVAEYLGTDHREYRAEPKAAEVMDFLAWHFDEPFGDSSAVPTYYVSRLTRNRVKVALSGDGGDESFLGYRRYYYDGLEHRLRRATPGFLLSLVARPLAGVWPRWGFLPRPLRAGTFLENLADSGAGAWFRSVGPTSGLAKRSLLGGDLREALGDYDTADWFADLYRSAPARDSFGRAQYLDFSTWLPDDILAKVDRASMAVGLEVRVPFLDHELVEMAARIPPEVKIEGRRGKAVLKDAMARDVPVEILQRAKRGFALPVRGWLRKDLRGYAEQALFAPDSAVRTFFDADRVRALWRRHQRLHCDNSDVLWLLLAFQAWARTFLRDGASSGRTRAPARAG